MGATAAMTVLAGGAAYSAREGHIARKDASAESDMARAEEKARQKEIDDKLAAEKAAANKRLTTRMDRTGTSGTILGGKKTAPTVFGSAT